MTNNFLTRKKGYKEPRKKYIKDMYMIKFSNKLVLELSIKETF